MKKTMNSEEKRNNNGKRFAFTVGELIEILKVFPTNMPVVTSGYEDGYDNISQPKILKVKHEPESKYYSGEFQIAEDIDKETIEVLALQRVVRND
jgi:hypothetical protein